MIDHTEIDVYDHRQDIEMVPLLQAVLYQAVYDCININSSRFMKAEALEWLSNENDRMLQLCLQACNISHDMILKKVAKKGWNLDI